MCPYDCLFCPTHRLTDSPPVRRARRLTGRRWYRNGCRSFGRALETRSRMTSPLALRVPIETELATILDRELDAALSGFDGRSPLLGGMARYHLGYVDASFQPLPDPEAARGKRFRPAIAMLCCGAVGGQLEAAGPLAAAIELLHNFTLIHDDIQDDSPLRRHRPTVWSLWTTAQAINAGDALFAVAHRALFRLAADGIAAELVLRIADAFDAMTLDIVDGQVRDLTFERRQDVSVDEYLTMIGGKTAAIVRFAAWAGALVGGANHARADQLAAFGQALGIGFQIQDDLLGIWGTEDETGKAAADDIRRKKQSLPLLVLRERCAPDDLSRLDEIYSSTVIGPDGIAGVLDLLAKHDVRAGVEKLVGHYHELAKDRLAAASISTENDAGARLSALVGRLAKRGH